MYHARSESDESRSGDPAREAAARDAGLPGGAGGARRRSAEAGHLDGAFDVPFLHRVRFARGVLDPGSTVLRDVLAEADRTPVRTIAFVDGGLAAARPGIAEELEAWARAHDDVVDLAASPEIVVGGEAAKNDDAVVRTVLDAIERDAICRQSFVIAIGGGAVLDAVGYAASIAHRGVRLVRLPTTTLAQDDAGVGVKNGINAYGKKNFLGTFAVPWAVVNDASLLETLPDRAWRAGFSEAVKVALLKDRTFFGRIEAGAARIAARDAAAADPVIRRCCELHLKHIVDGGDPFESASARPLDFGHWSAHRLEAMTGHEVCHGEAVAIGIAIDVDYAARLGLLAGADRDRIAACLRDLGLPVGHPALARADEVMAGIEEFREHLGGELTLTLLRSIGEPVDVHEVDDALMRAVLADRARA